MKSIKISLIALLVSFVWFSCSSPSNNQASKDSTAVVDSAKSTKIEYPLPTPFEVTQMLNKAGASYILNLSNSVKNIDKYMTEKSKAVNLGVYGADLAYASTFNKTEETRHYLTNTQKLTDELGIASAFNQGLVQNAEANINNADSLHKVITTSYYDTFDFLNKNGKGSIAVLVLTGGWVEGIYLSTQLAAVTKKNDEIVKGILNHKFTIEKLFVLLEQYQKENPAVKEVYDLVKDVKELYAKLPQTGDVDKKQLSELTSKVESVRAKLIE